MLAAIPVTILGASFISPIGYPLAAKVEVLQPPASSSIADSRSTAGLAAHLKKIGAKMYGAYWCPHCAQQKELFGEAAFRSIDYVECDPSGTNARPSLCKKAKITGYPTWEIKGKLYPGTQSLEDLAKLSGYSGPSNF